MNISPITFVIVCPLLFLAGFVDAIGGGGGLISLPAYMLAGLPVHNAIATNKLSSCCGTALATARFVKNKLVDLKLAVPTVFAAITGSYAGARLSMLVNEKILEIIMLVLLPVVAYAVLNKKIFSDSDDEEISHDLRTYMVAVFSALIIGMYDGFYGPGTGTFLIIAFTVLGKLSAKRSNAQAKVINLTTNVTSLAVFLSGGQVIVSVGLVCALCNMAGGYIGAGMAMKNSSKIIRPVIIIVLILLVIKILSAFFLN